MSTKRTIEVFSAGCPVCKDTIDLVKHVACPSCDVTVRNMKDPSSPAGHRALGVRSVPAVAIDGKLAGCCAGSGPEEAALRAAGREQALL